MLTRDQIFKTTDLTTEEVPVPEWGGTVYVRGMSGAERDAFEGTIIEDKKSGLMVNVRAKLAVRVLCDQNGERIFTDQDADALGKKSGKALDRVFETAQRLCGIGNKDVAELEKNS